MPKKLLSWSRVEVTHLFLECKRHLPELLIYFFNLKKSASEAHRLLAETYGEAALSKRSCRE